LTICLAHSEEKLARIEREASRQQQSPIGKFENFLTASNQQAELDTLRSQLDEVKVRLKAARAEAAKLDQASLY
jgi:hypothetical protein